MADDKVKVYDQATGKEIEINPEGSLGLLALGDIVVKPWREVRITSGYEKELLERIVRLKEETEKKQAEMKRKREVKLKEQQQKNEQKNS